ncbi:TNFAIP3-interacting protein 2 [Spea bombifrons]|uniref:TNFAIP3-interacting protein 2 n=1 Tax=Spea bombifrons TaxID=233779 RepID=UPI00234AD2F9|nr:TNFAIP3-interacting protein 2 [Spea bombifrons]
MLSISDGSTDPLLARFKLLEETVDKLHRENRTLKTKLQGYNTLSTFYHEARQQMRTLNLQLAAKDTVIQRLQAHHTRSPAEDPHMDPSKSLVENLMDHLNKMREQLKETERLSREKVDALNQEIQRLNQQLAEKDGQIHQMSSWPPHEKEMEICRLQRSLAEKERVQATSEVLCRTLSDETHQLRRKLATTAEMCQHLVRLLEETHGSEIQNVNELANKNTENVNDVSQDKLREEIRLLKKKVLHVEDLNAKWQKYDASREEYVKGLLLQLKEMKTQHEQQKGPHTGRLHVELLQKEINRLNKLLEEKMNESVKLKEEAEDMGRARLADGEHIQMLEQQLLVYKDDFTSERADRERAQSRIQELCEEIARLKQQTRKPDEKQSGGSSQIHAANKNKAVIPKNETAESRRKATSAERAEGRGNSSSERRVQDELQCPLCLRVFQDKLGENFLEHISECCQ